MKQHHLTIIISILCALMIALSFGGPVQAKDVSRNEAGDTAVRGAPCVFRAMVEGEWRQSPSSCSMLKSASSDRTLVWIGKGRLLIVRDPDERGFAKLYRIAPGTDDLGFMGNAIASGSCWVGKTMEFCAK